LVFGLVLGQIDHDFAKPWLTAAMTLFVVAIVLLLLVIRDQRRAIKAVETAQPRPAGAAGQGDSAATPTGAAGPESPGSAEAAEGRADAGADSQTGSGAAALAAHVASVERGRIAALGGVVNLIWLVILVLMVWQP